MSNKKARFVGGLLGACWGLFVRNVYFGEIDDAVMVSRPKQFPFMHFPVQGDGYCVGAGYIQRCKVLRWLADMDEGRSPQIRRELFVVLVDEILRIHVYLEQFRHLLRCIVLGLLKDYLIFAVVINPVLTCALVSVDSSKEHFEQVGRKIDSFGQRLRFVVLFFADSNHLRFHRSFLSASGLFVPMHLV